MRVHIARGLTRSLPRCPCCQRLTQWRPFYDTVVLGDECHAVRADPAEGTILAFGTAAPMGAHTRWHG